MDRVLVTGGAGTTGAAVVRRLLRDPDYEVRGSDRRGAPDWMREGCVGPSPEVDAQRRWPAVDKARELLGWKAQAGAGEGIARTVEWMRPRLDAAPA